MMLQAARACVCEQGLQPGAVSAYSVGADIGLNAYSSIIN